MLKGIYKEFITVKISENPLYEEAVFILKNPKKAKQSNKDMLFEANRILCEQGIKPLKKKKKRLLLILFSILFLILGMLLGFLCAFLLQNLLWNLFLIDKT